MNYLSNNFTGLKLGHFLYTVNFLSLHRSVLALRDAFALSDDVLPAPYVKLSRSVSPIILSPRAQQGVTGLANFKMPEFVDGAG